MNRYSLIACQFMVVVVLSICVSGAGVVAQAIPPSSQEIASAESAASPDASASDQAESRDDASNVAADGTTVDVAGDIEVAVEPVASAEEQESTAIAVELPRPPTPLAEPHWRGYTPRWVGLYGSQLADLIPESFRPISIKDLAIALRDDSQQLQPPSEIPVPQLTIVAGAQSELLVGISSALILPENTDDRPAIVDVSSSESWQRYRLGELNLNLAQPADGPDHASTAVAAIEPMQPRILSDAEGNCFAWGAPGSRIDFDWSVRCQHTAEGRQWTLRLPAATITRFYLRVATDTELVAEGGSLAKLTSAPAWDQLDLPPYALKQVQPEPLSGDQPFVWYAIETNPGQPLVLRQRSLPSAGTGASSLSVVRGCHLQSRWLGDQLHWTYRMTLDANSSHDLSELAWADGEVTAVRRDNVPLSCVWTGNSVRWINEEAAGAVDDATTAVPSNQTATTWVMEGVSRREGNQVPLPRPLFPADRFVVPPQTWHVQIDIPNWSVLSEAALPQGWSVRRLPVEYSKPAEPLSQEGDDHDSNTGVAQSSTVTWMASGPAPTVDTPWYVSIFPNDAFVFADHQMRFEMDESSIQARGKVTVEMPHGSLGPVTFDLQDGFQFEFIGVGEGRRNVPTGTAAGQGRQLTIWPGGDEVVDNRVVVYVSGRARRTNISGRMTSESMTIPEPVAPESVDSDETPPPQNANTAGDLQRDPNSAPESSRSIADESSSNESHATAISDESSLITESLWLMRAIDCPGQLLATIVPPAGLSWSAKAAIEPSRVAFAELSAAERRFFAPLPGDAIVFGGAIESTPEVTLEKPDVNLSVSLRTLLRATPSGMDAAASAFHPLLTDPSSAKNAHSLWQTLELKTEGTAGEIRSMRLRIAAKPNREQETADARPSGTSGAARSREHQVAPEQIDGVPPPWQPMQWFVQLQPGQPETPLGQQAVTRHYIENAGDWEVRITLPPQFTNQSLLVGRRRLKMTADGSGIVIGLPNVPDAASQSAEIWLDSSLQLKKHTESLIGVPLVDANLNGQGRASAAVSSSGLQRGTRVATTARYRYAPNDQRWVEVLPRTHRSPSGLVVSQRFVAEASVCGTDRLRMTCLARSGAEILLTFPPSLHLVELRCDGVLVTPRPVPGRGVVIPAPAISELPVLSSTATASSDSAATDSDPGSASPGSHLSRLPTSSPHWRRIEANWVNQTPLNNWYRWYQFPEIEMNQLIVDTRHELLAADGTRVFQLPDLADPWFPSAAPLLLPIGFVTGVGWVAALVLLALACMAGRRSLAVIGAGLLMTAIAVLLWPSAATPMMTFVAVPLTLAAMQLATSHWRRTDDGDEDDALPRNGSPSKIASNARFSGAANVCWWIAVTFSLVGLYPVGNRLHGQETSVTGKVTSSQLPSVKPVKGSTVPTIDVLVPLQSDGRILGNKIYIPETFYNDLYFSSDRMPWQNPMIDRVAYRLRLISPLDNRGKTVDKETFLGANLLGNKPENRDLLRDAVRDIAKLTDEILAQTDVATLEAKIGLTLPRGIRRIRIPYQLEQIKSVMQISETGDPITVRWGGEKNGRAWVEVPASGRDAERVELTISLRCQLQSQSPWVVVSCDLPPLAAADIVVSKTSAVENVMLLTPTTSCFVDFPTNMLGNGSTPSSLVVRSDLGEQVSNVIPLGSQRQLSLRFQLQTAVASEVVGSGVRRPDTDPSGDIHSNSYAINESTLPWNDPLQWHHRYWVHSERGKTVIECEFEARQPLPPEVIIAIVATAPRVVPQEGEGNVAGTPTSSPSSAILEHPACVLVGTHWAIVPGLEDGKSLGTQTMRLMSLSTPTRPIRLAWTLATPRQGTWQIRMPSIVVQPAGAPGQAPAELSIAIPSAEITVAATPTAATSSAAINPIAASTVSGDVTDPPTSMPWIAWTFADDVQPDWSTMGEFQQLAADQFYAKWTGYLSSIDRAVIGNVSGLTLKHVRGPLWDVTTRHEVSIDSNAQHVRFLVRASDSEAVPRNRAATSDALSASATPTVGATSYHLRLPERARLLDWRFEADGSPAISPRAALPDAPATATSTTADVAAVPTKDVTDGNNDAAAAVPAAADNRPPWTVTHRDGITTLCLITDHRSFNIAVDAIVPHRDGTNPNELGLMSISKLAANAFSTTNHGNGSAASGALDVTDNIQQSNELQITRHVDTVVNWEERVPSKQMDASGADAASLLAAGEILIDRFQSDGPILDAFAAARFTIRKNDEPFDIDSRITLRWEEGRWTAQTDCRVTSSYCPDYIDIVLPTRWCESLRIEPPCVSSRQPTLDPAMQVMRLQLRHDPTASSDDAQPAAADSKSDLTRSFQLISRLAVSEITRVSVPELRIMDAQRHRIDVVVPTRLTNEQVRWRSNFAGPIEQPRWRLKSQPATQLTGDSSAGGSASEPTAVPAMKSIDETAIESDAELSVYAVTSPRWSIDLETLPRTDRVAKLLHTDHCVLAQPATAALLMITRFDVLPGDQPSLRLGLDPAVELQGVWAATQQADIQPIPNVSSNQSSAARGAAIWEVSLPFSRLSQTVEVLTSLRHDLPDVLLPSLQGLSVDAPRASVNWCQVEDADGWKALSIDQAIGGGVGDLPATTSFHNDARATSLISAPIAPSTRVRWLASNVVKAIRASSDSLADRRDDEVAVWMQPWITRYQMLCHSAGRQIGDDDPDDAAAPHRAQQIRTAGIAAADLLSWQEMDAYIVAQETRYFPDDTLVGETASISWSDYLAITKPPGYAERWTFAWSGRRLPIQILATQHAPLSEQTRQPVMRGGLFFLLASLLVIATLLPRRKVPAASDGEQTAKKSWNGSLVNPSLWLLVLSILGLVLIPLPMALGLLVVTLVLGAGHAKRWLAPQWKVGLRKGPQS